MASANPAIQLHSWTLLNIFRAVVIAWVSILIPLALQGQTIENVNATPRGDLIIVEYDLKPTAGATEFKISLYGSHNNYREPIRFVTGDVGERVMSGTRRTITWAVKNELMNFTGDIQFEVRGEPYIPIKPFAFTNPAENNTVKRGSKLKVEWTGGSGTESVQLQLIQDNQVKKVVGNAVNTGTFSWKVPANTSKGTYQLSLTAPSGNATSMPFRVEQKMSTLMKVVPLAIIAGVVIWQLLPDDDPSNTLPPPPDRPE
jgi:hypothetical protein